MGEFNSPPVTTLELTTITRSVLSFFEVHLFFRREPDWNEDPGKETPSSMSRKVWYQLVDEATRGDFAGTYPASVLSDGVHDIEDLTRKIQADYNHPQAPGSNLLSAIEPSQLRVYKNRETYDATNSEPLKPGSSVESLGGYNNLLIVESGRSLHDFVKDWKYQGASEIANSLQEPLVKHFSAWKDESYDKSVHPINLVVSGKGTGKSRMLDEMKGLLCEAASRAENQGLLERMQNAYVFNVLFENSTAACGCRCDPDHPEYDVSRRMLYQLTKENVNWSEFLHRMKTSCGEVSMPIEDVIRMLAELETVKNVTDLTVILCIDGLQRLQYDCTQSCDLYNVMSALCCFLNSSRAFAVCVCSATVAIPVEYALRPSRQARNYLVPTPLRGEIILKPATRLQRQLVDDMGGHGRALEVLNN